MEYTPDDLRCRYPEFEDTTEYPDDRISMFIEDGQDDIGLDEGHWGGIPRYKRALSALVAHYVVVGTASESGDYNPLQAIQSKSAGDVKITHVTAKAGPASTFENRLMATTYGQEFLSLRRRTFVSAIVVPV